MISSMNISELQALDALARAESKRFPIQRGVREKEDGISARYWISS